MPSNYLCKGQKDKGVREHSTHRLQDFWDAMPSPPSHLFCLKLYNVDSTLLYSSKCTLSPISFNLSITIPPSQLFVETYQPPHYFLLYININPEPQSLSHFLDLWLLWENLRIYPVHWFTSIINAPIFRFLNYTIKKALLLILRIITPQIVEILLLM